MSSRVLPQFDLLTPQTVTEAVTLLSQHQGEAAVLAGGTDLLVWNYIRNNPASHLLSLSGIPDLDYLRHIPGEGLRIGAKAKVARLLDSPDVANRFPALYQAAYTFATPQIRNMATVIGNLLRASPAGDCSCAVLALGGEVVLQGPIGERTVAIDDFWLDYHVTARRVDELAVELRIPEPSESTRSAFHRLTRVHEDLSKLNVAVRLEMEGRTCRDIRIAMGCIGPVPLRLRDTESVLKGSQLTEENLRRATNTVQEEIKPIDDQRSTAEYRREVAGVILRRVIEKARGNGEQPAHAGAQH